MGQVMRRSYFRRYPRFHQHTSSTPWGGHPGPGGALYLGGPAGPVSRGGSDLTYNGMDPSDSRTWVRPYSPQPGMVALLNFDPFMNGPQSHYRTGGGLAGNARPRQAALDRRAKRRRWGER